MGLVERGEQANIQLRTFGTVLGAAPAVAQATLGFLDITDIVPIVPLAPVDVASGAIFANYQIVVEAVRTFKPVIGMKTTKECTLTPKVRTRGCPS